VRAREIGEAGGSVHRAPRCAEAANGNRLEILECDQPVTIADQFGFETVQVRIAAVLVQFKMAGRVKCDDIHPPPVAVNSQRDLLSHRAAREQRRGLLAQKVGDAAFERLDELTLAVVVGPSVGRKCRCRRVQQLAGRDRTALTEPPFAPAPDIAPIALRHKPRLPRPPGTRSR
jgi:hypothetical protein